MPAHISPHTLQAILEALAEAPHPMRHYQIAGAIHRSETHTASALKRLYREKLLDRQPCRSRGQGGMAFEYFLPDPDPPPPPPAIPETEENPEYDDWLFWSDVRQAVARARPNWKTGELTQCQTTPPSSTPPTPNSRTPEQLITSKLIVSFPPRQRKKD